MRGLSRRGVMGIGAGLAAGALGGTRLAAQDAYPSRFVRVVCPFPAGSATDTQARFLADQIGKTAFGQKLIVENKAGATGNLAAAEVARAEPDGYTVLLATNSSHAANIHLYKKLPFDPVKDFTPIARLTRNPLVLVVAESSPAKSVMELIALAKASPGKLNFGTGNTGSLAAAQLLKSLAGIDITRVPYQGTPQAITDLLGGRIDLMVTDIAVVREFVKVGKLRALGVTTAAPLKTMPGVPTIAEAGVPGYEFAAWSGLYGPAGLPDPVVAKLHDAFVAAMQGPEADRFFDTVGLEPNPGTREQLAAYMEEQTRLWEKIIAQTGLEKQ